MTARPRDVDRAARHHGPTAPSPWVRRFAGLVPAGGTVLDLACGDGRHSRLFAERGHPVVAVDIDLTALGDLARNPRIEAIEADLEAGPWPLGDRRFAGIVVTNYLWRPLMPRLAAAVDEGGALIYESFAMGNERYGRPRNPDHLLRPGELLQAFRDGFRLVAYEHGLVDDPRPAVVQRIATVKSADSGAH
ncbi:MAG: class I SAM-dependent methyltransferase [Kiloniellales bacterium]